MADRSRVSIYFKSAPFGSFNHSHADQNSFLIYAHGRVLAMDSGYYDRYNSPHWRDWYKQTKAHNAVTFDDGEGQSLGPLGLGSFNNNGRITRFHSTTEYDLVGGDATAAYDGKVKSAKRWLVFIKPATLLVIDQLEAAVPRLWEWNLHTPAPLLLSGNAYRMSTDGTDLCVRVWSDAEIDLKTRSGYTPSPEISGALAPHVWNTFVLRRKSPTGIFVSVNRIDCAGPEPEVSFVNGLPSIKVANRVVTFTGTDVSVK